MNRRAIKLVENGVLESAKRTIDIEKRGLEALEQALDNGLAGPFTRAIEVIGDISGRVIVTGVGKSGHIGAKLAATFASTGTPAFFVHAAEANHGDLGMIARDDVVLAISKGGESAELKSIISFTRRFSIPLIALTCGESSSLATAADIVLLVPNEQEACPNGLAPTTSTLMQLALGDALAVALLEARGFTATDFHVFHPGGKLGASLTHVADIMHTGERLPLVAKGTPMPEAITVLSRKHFGCVGVLDEEGRLCGIVTEGDMARNLTRNLAELAVDDIMTKTPKTVKPTMLATAALALLNQHSIGALIVIDDDRRPLGLVHFHDLLRIGVA
ncbi:UNVERIFIED_ORG: arabinose-5-phosphate isomerase [Rhizobium esperanzae]|uniref:KpsF/GutQ family sugar-phosphate isomerase n=1 Tax=Rhizobium phaseoli TaxID=396 RepID=UPI000202DE80|nr:KpsF/GutQ family sugar-phosphate isomerase [Rhizobium phaseoli]EGE56764.1 arabinose 5-phosphate isomerase protein (involved in capsule formation) [Rhizobium etli CNPAF512]KEC74552.1 arabinose 5-phosphate isomerase [Rhizobium leguminosarum bv. phaseoli CCGM1]ANM05884.1 arabinose 5-phosphate isomerase KdsD/KpsF [Rhizobium phaseoli]PWI52736.1 KpsF/GutQ family sugar-phosphate isomerase [Rhizobium phaseoli]RUM19057.1 KpsF/GutQ family sugar-phosphate isomerase [Rhizobium phaseoli]